MSNNRVLPTTIYPGVDPQGKVVQYPNWEAFVVWLKQTRKLEVGGKKSSPSFSPLPLTDGYRVARNAEGKKYWGVVLDLDRVNDREEVFQSLSPYTYFAYTTWSSTPEAERWRIIFPSTSDLTLEQVVELVNYFEKRIGKAAQVDNCSRGAIRLWFGMSLPSAGKGLERYNEGRWVSPRHVISVNFSGVKSSMMPENIDEGDRNNLLASYLRQQLFVTSSEVEIRRGAYEWNDRLPTPLGRSEVNQVVRSAWRWWTTNPEGLERRRIAMQAIRAQLNFSQVDWEDVDKADDQFPMLGEFMYPGLTIMSGKAKSGKTRFLWQLLTSFQRGRAFLRSKEFPGLVATKTKCAFLAIEDTKFGLKKFALDTATRGVMLYLQENLEKLYADGESQGLNGFAIFERLVDYLYRKGVRLLAIDPISLLEQMFHMAEYPGAKTSNNIHSQEFQRLRYYQRMSDKYPGLNIVLVFHHGKNKSGRDMQDPQDMIAGTSGIHAAAVNIMSLVRVSGKQEDDMEVNRHVLYMGGRHSPTRLYTMEMDDQGWWECKGDYTPEIGRNSTQKPADEIENFIETLVEMGGLERTISGGELSEKFKLTARHIRNQMTLSNAHPEYKIVSVLGKFGGYKLVKKDQLSLTTSALEEEK